MSDEFNVNEYWLKRGREGAVEDPRYADVVGKSVRLPLVGRLIPIVADEYADPEMGTTKKTRRTRVVSNPRTALPEPMRKVRVSGVPFVRVVRGDRRKPVKTRGHLET